MHPNEFFPRDLLEDRNLVLAWIICLTHLSPEYQKRLIGGVVVDLKPNQALIELPLRTDLLSQKEFEEKLGVLQQLELAQSQKKDGYYIILLPKIRVEEVRPSVDVDESHPDLPPITFSDFSERYLKQVGCDTSLKNLENSRRVVKHANRHFGSVLLGKLESRHLDEFKTKRLEEIRAKKEKGSQAGKTTVNMDIRTLKRALEYAIDWGYLKENPFRRIKQIRKEDRAPMAMTKDEFDEMLMCVEDEQLKKFYQLGVLTGMRRGELLYLTWEDVDLEQRTISVQSSEEYRVKQGKGRMLPVSEQVGDILKSLRANDPYVFANEKGLPYKEDYVTKKFKEAIRNAELREDFHLHCLRHTFATWLAASGVPALHIKELLGHTYLKTTEAYTRIPSKDLRGAVELITLPPT